jgi:pimeloyl-ACP methyl ester carboxylesterase
MVTAWQEQYPFSPHRLPVGGHAMHYVDEGPREGAPLLFVHGNPTWSFYWRNLINAFKDRYRCVAPDHVGCGLSDKPGDFPYRLEDHISNLEKLILELDLRNITLVVHDWGGAIGMGAAVRHPQRFKRFVIFNTAAFRSQDIPLRIAMCRIPGVGKVAVRLFNGFAQAATVMATEKGLAPGVREGLLAPYDSWANRIAVHQFVLDIPLVPEHPSYATLKGVEDGLGTFAKHPMQIIWGEQDWCFTPRFREGWQSRFPQAEVHPLGDAGHYVVEDAVERITPLMRDFLKRTDA